MPPMTIEMIIAARLEGAGAFGQAQNHLAQVAAQAQTASAALESLSARYAGPGGHTLEGEMGQAIAAKGAAQLAQSLGQAEAAGTALSPMASGLRAVGEAGLTSSTMLRTMSAGLRLMVGEIPGLRQITSLLSTFGPAILPAVAAFLAVRQVAKMLLDDVKRSAEVMAELAKSDAAVAAFRGKKPNTDEGTRALTFADELDKQAEAVKKKQKEIGGSTGSWWTSTVIDTPGGFKERMREMDLQVATLEHQAALLRGKGKAGEAEAAQNALDKQNKGELEVQAEEDAKAFDAEYNRQQAKKKLAAEEAADRVSEFKAAQAKREDFVAAMKKTDEKEDKWQADRNAAQKDFDARTAADDEAAQRKAEAYRRADVAAVDMGMMTGLPGEFGSGDDAPGQTAANTAEIAKTGAATAASTAAAATGIDNLVTAVNALVAKLGAAPQLANFP